MREWLLSLPSDDRKAIGTDILTLELAWPVGMPLCRAIRNRKGLWEIRTTLTDGRIARVFFCVHDGALVLLHGFIKKSQKTPDHEIDLAERRKRGLG